MSSLFTSEEKVRIFENIPDSLKIQYAESFADNGEFDKGNQLINKVTSQNNEFELLNFSLYCALKKEDIASAQELFKDLKNRSSTKLNIEQRISLILSEAYLEHNKKNYFKSIHLNEYALSLIVKRKLDKKYLLKTLIFIGLIERS